MPQFMKNRTGVVAYRNDKLLNDESLGFVPCDINGADLKVKSDEVEVPTLTPISKQEISKKGKKRSM